MWFLIYVAVFTEGFSVETWGKYNTQEACLAEIHKAEIAVSFTNEGMMCLEMPGDLQIEMVPLEEIEQ